MQRGAPASEERTIPFLPCQVCLLELAAVQRALSDPFSWGLSILLSHECTTRYQHSVIRLQVRQFYTAPTLIRALEAHDDKFVLGSNRSSLRVLGTVGEPINPRAWIWFFQVPANFFF